MNHDPESPRRYTGSAPRPRLTRAIGKSKAMDLCLTGRMMDAAEAEALRTYVLKGGFLWADDFWGEYAWQAWIDQLGKALPPEFHKALDGGKDSRKGSRNP